MLKRRTPETSAREWPCFLSPVRREGSPGFVPLLLAVVVCFAWGCQTTGSGDVEKRETSRILTFGINARDYDEMARELAESILSDPRLPLGKGKVLALGPVDDDACIYDFDAVTFQERLQTILQRSHKLEVTFAINAIQKDSAAKARYDIRVFEWMKGSEKDEEFIATVGELVGADWLLFGRLSAQPARKGRQKEVTYRFNWKIGDCRTGLVKWTQEPQMVKSGAVPAGGHEPEWVTVKRRDSPVYAYEIGYARAGTAPGRVDIVALEDARMRFARQLGLSGQDARLISDVAAVQHGRHPYRWRAGSPLWILARYPKRQKTLLSQRIETGRSLRALFEAAKADLAAGRYGQAQEKLRRVAGEYAKALNPGFDAYDATLLQGQVAAAQRQDRLAWSLFSQVMKRAGSAVLRTKAEDEKRKIAPRRFWPMNERWDGRTVLLACTRSEGRETVPFPDLTRVLAQDCKEAELRCIDLLPTLQATGPLPGAGNISGTVTAAASRGPGVLLIVYVETDPALKGKKTRVPLGNGQFHFMPTPDTTVTFHVVSTTGGGTLQTGQFKELANTDSGRLAQRVAGTLIRKYLVPACPALKAR